MQVRGPFSLILDMISTLMFMVLTGFFIHPNKTLATDGWSAEEVLSCHNDWYVQKDEGDFGNIYQHDAWDIAPRLSSTLASTILYDDDDVTADLSANREYAGAPEPEIGVEAYDAEDPNLDASASVYGRVNTAAPRKHAAPLPTDFDDVDVDMTDTAAHDLELSPQPAKMQSSEQYTWQAFGLTEHLFQSVWPNEWYDDAIQADRDRVVEDMRRLWHLPDTAGGRLDACIKFVS